MCKGKNCNCDKSSRKGSECGSRRRDRCDRDRGCDRGSCDRDYSCDRRGSCSDRCCDGRYPLNRDPCCNYGYSYYSPCTVGQYVVFAPEIAADPYVIMNQYRRMW